jgi:hypothetical protein
MRMRRIMSALILAFAVGLSAACGGDADEKAPAGAGAPTGASASASPSVDVKADTERICKTVVAAFDAEKMQILELLLKVHSEDDQAARAKAVTDGAALVQRLKTVVDKETANAADPKVRTALQELIATLGRMLAPESMDDPDFETKMDAAVAAAAAYCPGLDA